MKFQWAKFSSMLDYDELIKVYSLAVNSAGITEKQIEMQMNTIARKAEQLKATFVGLTTNSGGGFAKMIKDGIDGVTRFVNVLNNVSTGTYAVVGTMLHASLAIYAGVKAYHILAGAVGIYRGVMATATVANGVNTASQGLNTGAQISNAMSQGAKAVATGVATAATNVNTGAQMRNAMATTIATGGLNIIAAVLVTAALAMDGYAMVAGDATKSNDKLTRSMTDLGKMEEQMGIKENLVQSLKQRYDYVDTLTNAHEKLTTALSKETEGSREYNKLQRSLGATQEELARIVGVTTEDIVQDGHLRMDLINQEKDNMENKALGIKEEIKGLKNAQIEYTQQSIQSAQDRIDALGSETKAWGYLAQAQMWAVEQYAAVMDAQISAKQKAMDVLPDIMITEQARASLNSDIEYRESLRNYKPASVTEEINANAEKITDLKLKQAQISLGNIDYSTVNQGSTTKTDEDNDSKGGSSGSSSLPSDPTKKIQRDTYKDAVTLDRHNAKLANDEYTLSLDKLNSKEEIYGKTTEITLERLRLLKERREELAAQELNNNAMAESLDAELIEAIASSQDLLKSYGVSEEEWKGMDKAAREGVLVQKEDVLEAYKDLKAIRNAKLAYEDDRSKVRLEGSKIDNEQTKLTAKLKPEDDYRAALDRNKVSEEIALANATNKLDMNNEIALNKIKLDTMLANKKLYVDELRRLDDIVAEDMIALNAKENEGNKDAIKKQLQLHQDAADNQRAIVARNAKDIIDLEYAKNAKINEGMAGITSDILVQGSTLRQIWGKLWNDLANDAIKALFRVNNSTPSLLGSILGLFGGGSTATGGTSWGNTFGTSVSGGQSFSFFTPGNNATGSIGNQEQLSWIREGNKEEAIIPLEDHRERGKSLWLQAGHKLGMLGNRGTNVTANVSPRTMEIAQQSSATAQMARINAEHLSRLDTQIGLMTQQNSMILTMLGQGGGQGGVVQPIVMSQSMDKGQLWSMIESMRRDGYKV